VPLNPDFGISFDGSSGGYKEDLGPLPQGIDPDGGISPPAPDSKPADLEVGRWYQANQAVCSTFCSGKGLENVASPDGAYCISGEARPKSAIDAKIKFTYGCSSSCNPQNQPTTCHGEYCYRPGQKQDDDDTDLTVGCFCR
jgi:hypothetical protein